MDRLRHSTPASAYAHCDLANLSEIEALRWPVSREPPPPWTSSTINYLGTRLVVEGMLPLMRRGGAIVTVGSTAAMGWEQRQDALTGLLAARDREAVGR